MAEGHKSKTTSWIAVLVIVVAFVLLGFALPMQSLALGVAGGIALLVGVVLVFTFGVMEDFH
ncbi:MAG: hypothetical protein LC789_00975 [Actinobacteria bacterium]|nr:hypothetical protein [Actinomycetota bacterium]MCA1722131.1 hypothetical protein [Actinomycetota bacterium]